MIGTVEVGAAHGQTSLKTKHLFWKFQFYSSHNPFAYAEK
jgi:hypothetical protein